MAMGIAGKKLRLNHIKGPLGVRGRNSDNRLIREKLGWEPKVSFEELIRMMFEADLQRLKKGLL